MTKSKLIKAATLAFAFGAAIAASAGDVWSIDTLCEGVYMQGMKAYPNPDSPLTIGELVTIRIRLANADRGERYSAGAAYPWVLKPYGFNISSDALQSMAYRPKLALSVGGVLRWADLVSFGPAPENENMSQLYFTDLIFQYKVQPGDLAQPLGLMKRVGGVYSQITADDLGYEYCIDMPSGWHFYNMTDSMDPADVERDADFRFLDRLNDSPGLYTRVPPASTGNHDELGPTRQDQDKALFTSRNQVHIRTVGFDDKFVDQTATPPVWRTVHQGSTDVVGGLGKGTVAIDGSAVYDTSEGYATMYIWSGDDDVITPVGPASDLKEYMVDGKKRKVLSLKITNGDTSVPFTLKATGMTGEGAYVFLSSAPTNIYLLSNGSLQENNLPNRWVTVGDPKKPGVSLMFGDNNNTTATAASDYAGSRVELTVKLSDTFTNDVTVTVRPKLTDGDGNAVNVYDKHVIASATPANSSNGWLQRDQSVTFDKNVDTEKTLYIYPLGATENTMTGNYGIDFEVEVSPADAAAYFTENPKATLFIDPQFPEIVALEDKDPSAHVFQFVQGKARDIEIAVDDGFRNLRHTTDAEGLAAGDTNLWTVVWTAEDSDDPEFQTKERRVGLVPEFVNGKAVLKFEGMSFPETGTFPSTIRVYNPDNTYSEIMATVDVTPPRQVFARLEKAYDESDADDKRALVTISLSRPYKDDLYAFFEPLNEAASNNVECANLAAEGNSGIAIARTTGEVADTMKLRLLDGTCSPKFRIVLCTSEEYDPAKVNTEYISNPVTFTVNNVAPRGTNVKIDKVAVEDGLTRTGTVPAENYIRFELELDDVKKDLLLPQSGDGYDVALKKWIAGIDDDDDVKTNILEKGLLLTRWRFFPPENSNADPKDVIVMGINKGRVSMNHLFPEECIGTNTVQVQALDKDMVADLLRRYTRAEIASWDGSAGTDDEGNPYTAYEDPDGEWSTELLDREWGPAYTVKVVVDDKPNVQLVPHGVYPGSYGQSQSDGWIYEDAEDAEFEIRLSKAPPEKTEVKVVLERLTDTSTIESDASLSDDEKARKRGTLSLKSESGTWVMTEENTNPATRFAIVTVRKNSNTTQKGQWLKVVDKDGTPYSRYRLTATVETDTGVRYDAGEYVLEVVNREPILDRIQSNVGMRYSLDGGAPTNAVPVTRRQLISINWTVKDWVKYDQDENSGIFVEWNSSEPNSRVSVTNQLTGTYETSFSGSGEDLTITVTIHDKDGQDVVHTWYFKVDASKSLYIFPTNPSRPAEAGKYLNAAGLGYGSVQANGAIGDVTKYVQAWDYPLSAGTAMIYAHGLGTNEIDQAAGGITRNWWVSSSGSKTTDQTQAFHNPDDTLESFVYCFLYLSNDDAGNESSTLAGGILASVDASRSVSLPKAEKDALTYDDSRVAVVFSKEWRELDNCGDVNADGIPDWALSRYGFGIYEDGQFAGNDLANISGFNDDEDFLPAVSTSGNGLVPNVQGKWQDNGGKFGALLELRGFHNGLNKGYKNRDGSNPAPDYSANEKRAYLAWKGLSTEDDLKAMGDGAVDALFNDNIADATEDLALANSSGGDEGWSPERPTDPTKDDTDEDGLPDGYEYWFWYGAKVGYSDNGRWQGRMTGRKLNLGNLQRFDDLQPEDILGALDPLAGNAATVNKQDTDNDGLLDKEEFLIGTNPFDCDTDNDGVTDGFEVMWGFNPLDAKDGNDVNNGANPDRDFMAYAGNADVFFVSFSKTDGETGVKTRYLYLTPDSVSAQAISFKGSLLDSAEGDGEFDLDSYMAEFDGETTIEFGRLEPRQKVSLDGVEDLVRSYRRLSFFHHEVYTFFGFDPRTAWNINASGYVADRWNDDTAGLAVNTRHYTLHDEYIYGDYKRVTLGWNTETFSDGRVDVLGTLKANCTNPNTTFSDKTYGDSEAAYSSDQNGADTSGDGIPDGWEIYVGGNPIVTRPYPWGKPPSDRNNDNDGLLPTSEYAGTDSSAAYPDCESIKNGTSWPNKFFPTDPFNGDTDGDGISDPGEGGSWSGAYHAGNQTWESAAFSFRYGEHDGEVSGTCVRGGGLNPCSIDTDEDGLPDLWERQYAGVIVTAEGVIPDRFRNPNGPNVDAMYTEALKVCDNFSHASPQGEFIVGGMDGTYADATTVLADPDPDSPPSDAYVGATRDFDFDGDGLENYQEYLVQAMRCWRYDDAETPLMGRALKAVPVPTSVTNVYEYVDNDTQEVVVETNVVTRLVPSFVITDPVDSPDAFVRMDFVSGVELLASVQGSPFWEQLSTDYDYYKGLAEYDMRALGYMELPPCEWDKAYIHGTGRLMQPIYGNYFGWRYMLPPATLTELDEYGRPVRSGAGAYVSTDPRRWDTDADGMDDYWELFHGINPLLGGEDVVGSAYAGVVTGDSNPWAQFARGYYDPVLAPWRTGLPDADPDGDGLRNVDESIMGNMTSPTTYHTDPSPRWMTDKTSRSSYVTQYYQTQQSTNDTMTVLLQYQWQHASQSAGAGSMANSSQYATEFDTARYTNETEAYLAQVAKNFGEEAAAEAKARIDERWYDRTTAYTRAFRYAFEETEGYDTDGDWRGDGHEVVRAALPSSDPLDATDPNRRAALYLPGENACAYSYERGALPVNDTYDAFRQFTVECWVKPEALDREQTVVERGFSYPPANFVNSNTVWRANFRLAIDEGGVAYGVFDNDNALLSGDQSFSSMRIQGYKLEENEWTHLALSFDGTNFTIYVNGVAAKSAKTQLIPANGIRRVQQDPGNADAYPNSGYETVPGSNTVGARRAYPVFDWSGGFEQFTDFFKGYVSELRFWDGARTPDEIRGAYRKRFGVAEAEANRKLVQEKLNADPGATRNDMDGKERLPAQLYSVYNFQQLPAASSPEDVALVPSGFQQVEDNSVLEATDPAIEIGWWSETTEACSWCGEPLASTVYTDRRVLPLVHNLLPRMPRFDKAFSDSTFWSEPLAGYTPASARGVSTYAIPNGGDPYPGRAYGADEEKRLWRYRKAVANDISVGQEMASNLVFQIRSEFVGLDDLVPLGGAYAKLDADYWDGMGTSTVWTDTGADADGDDLPDWWEVYARSEYGAGDDLDPYDLITYSNGVVMPAWQAYMRDLARGLMPDGDEHGGAFASTKVDADGDGLADWWQNIYSLKDGADGDADGDGLANYTEYLLSEVFKLGRFDPTDAYSVNRWASDYFARIGQSYAGEIFTDHDFIDDSWENSYPSATSRYLWDAKIDADDDGWSNYAEFQAGTDPTRTGSLSIDDVWMDEYPVPVVETRITYEGTQAIGGKPFVVKAWRRSVAAQAEQRPIPDAVWTIGGSAKAGSGSADTNSTKYVGINPKKETLLNLSPGSVVAGSVEIQFKDLNWLLYDESSAQYYAVFDAAETATWNSIVGDRQNTEEPWRGELVDRGRDVVVGEIDYETGAVTVDFGKLKDPISINGDIRAGDAGMGYQSIYQLDKSYVRVLWRSLPVVTGASATYYLGEPDPRTAQNNSFGHLKEGLNLFVAFCDLDEDGKYTAGEPYGVAPAVDVSWNRAQVVIELTDTSPVSARFSVTEDAANDRDILYGIESGNLPSEYIANGKVSGGTFQRVRVVRTLINGYTCSAYGIPDEIVLDKIVNVKDDPIITEADFLGPDSLDLDWATLASDLEEAGVDSATVITNVSYRVVLGDGDASASTTNNLLPLVFNRWFSTPDVYYGTVPRQLGPAVVVSPSPTFKWTIPGGANNYTAFVILVRDESRNIVWQSGYQPMPPRVRDPDYGWRYEWTAPIFADDMAPNGKRVLENNKTYSWQIGVVDSRYMRGPRYSDGANFRMNVLNSTSFGTANVAVRYFGPDAVSRTGVIRVQAFESPDFSGQPVGEGYVTDRTALADATHEPVANARIIGLRPGTYYLRAFIDMPRSYGNYNATGSTNGQLDGDEAWGYLCERDVAGCSMYKPRSIKVGPGIGESLPLTIYIEDVDTDQDNLPDAWEIVQKKNLGTLGVGNLDQELHGGIAVKQELTDQLTGAGGLASGLSVMLSRSLNNPYAAAMVLGVDVSSSTSASDVSKKVNASVGPNEVDAEGRKTVFTRIALDRVSRTVSLDVKNEVVDASTSSVDPALLAIYEFETTGSLTVTLRLWNKATLDGEWQEVAGSARDVEIGTSDATFNLSLGDDVDLASGFFKATLERKQ